MAGNETRRRPNASSSDDPAATVESEEKVLKNRPKASALRQQRLPAWQPIMTATTVIPAVFCVGIVFIPIGVALYLASDSVVEVRVEYSQRCGPPASGQPPCKVPFEVKTAMDGDVYFYYYLANFYQNHRRYVKSRNDQQYLGHLDQITDCDPFGKDDAGNIIVPCGAIANSMFSDTFQVTADNKGGAQVPMTSNGVVWDVDEDRKFANPEGWTEGDCGGKYQNTVKPPNWEKPICAMPGGMKNVDFIVWMRTAALPNFRKLYRILDRTTTPDFSNGLPAGNYTLIVANNYAVEKFGGAKEFIISTTSWAGGKNGFLGIAYMVVGSLAILLGVIFIIIHIKFGHSVDELSNINRQS